MRQGAECELTGKCSQRVRADSFGALRERRGIWFCGNVDCLLHVRVGDPGVVGAGEWAVRADGVVTSRALYRGRMLCDVCGRREMNSNEGGET